MWLDTVLRAADGSGVKVFHDLNAGPTDVAFAGGEVYGCPGGMCMFLMRGFSLELKRVRVWGG